MSDQRMVAALFVERGGCYDSLFCPGVDIWPEDRDARVYSGPWPVVAHPPCARWSRLAGLVESRGGPRRGEDDGCFSSALESVRRWGGVLEHPAETAAWPAFGLPRPGRTGWTLTGCGGWVCAVAQSAYGHRAQKLTWLYFVGPEPQDIDWSRPPGTCRVSEAHGHDRAPVERMGRRERIATPPAFRDLLLSLARSVYDQRKRVTA